MTNDLPLAIPRDRVPLRGVGREAPHRCDFDNGLQDLGFGGFMRVDLVDENRDNPDFVVGLFDPREEGE